MELFPLFAFAVALFGMSPRSDAKSCTLENKDGKSIDVTLVNADEEKVLFKLKGSHKEMSYALSDLSEESQKIIKEWLDSGGPASTRYEVRVFTGKSNKKNDVDDIDDRVYTVQPKIELINRSRFLPTAEMDATIVFFGRPVLYPGVCALDRQKLSLSRVEKLGTIVVEGKEAVFEYDEVDNGEIYGARYRGYCMVLTDKDGNEVFRKAVPSSFKDVPLSTLMNAGIGQVLNSDWSSTSQMVRLR